MTPQLYAALEASADVADVRLKRKIRYIHAKLKARGKFRSRTHYAPATPVASFSDPKVRSNPLPPNTIGENQHRLQQGDPGQDAQKHPRRTCSPGGSILSSPKLDDRDTHATSPDDGVDGDDDASEEASPNESGGSCSSSSAGGDQCIGASAR